MATIVGTDERQIQRATCGHCARILEYTKGEVRTLWSGKDYGGGPDGAKGFSCPSCGQDVITERW
jgi:hypothetical protein